MRGIFKVHLLIQEIADDKWFSQPFSSEVSLPLSPHGSLGLFHSPPPAECWQCWFTVCSVGYLLGNCLVQTNSY